MLINHFKIMDAAGVIIQASPYSVKETIDRIQAFLQQKGATIYARIDQQAEANNAGYDLLPLEFLLFGNPKAGGAIMRESPLSALDLPLKIIAWQDEQNNTQIAFNDGQYLKERYALSAANIAPMNIAPLIDMALKQWI
jgi:uncharacterized protein (DUF302 family)